MKFLAALPRPYPPYASRTARNAAVLWLLLHANLGTPPAWETGIALTVAGALETVAQLLVR
jgi:hypothetical protein